jgi:hypothetical protein
MNDTDNNPEATENESTPTAADEIAKTIRRHRDEIRLKMHLAKADAKNEWEKLEGKWAEIERRAEPLTGAVKDSAEQAGDSAKKVAGSALDVLMRELNDGYAKLRKRLE